MIPLDRFLGCLLGQAVGDAVCAPYEGLPADFVFHEFGPVHEILAAPSDEMLRYTDDTQQMIAVAEELAEHGAITDGLIRRFAECYEPERGYGQGARRILEAVKEGGDWSRLADEVFPGGSFGNGAAMRVAPVGLFFDDLDKVAEQARLSALPTHRHPLGIEGAVLLAVAVALAARGPPFVRRAFFDELEKRCESEEFRWQIRAARRLRGHAALSFLGNSLPAHRSVTTAIACFSTSPNDYEEAIGKALALGDDVDTLAAMAGALSGAHLGAVPARWVERVEGAAHLRTLAERLHRKASGAA